MSRLPANRPERGGGLRRENDRGTVVVVVALVVVLVLLPAAALALDLRAVYGREGLLQQAADRAATAGAAELAVRQRDHPGSANALDPVSGMDAARAKAVSALCVDSVAAGWTTACGGDHAWAGDGDKANGEVSFYFGKPSAGHLFDATQSADDATAGVLVSGIRVVTPPSRVTFGIGAAFTADHVETTRASTAGLFTVLPAKGFLPMFLRPGEHGGFCTRSAPASASAWASSSPGGAACSPAAARGVLAAGRTDAAQNAAAVAWNAATGFDQEHLPLPGRTATLQPQFYVPPYGYAVSPVSSLAPGLFGGAGSAGAPPRLGSGSCRGGHDTTSGPRTGLESADLASFLLPAAGDRNAFRALVRAGTRPAGTEQGWLDPAVLRCGRLAVVPVLGGLPDPLPYTGMASLTYPVTGLRLIWLDDRLWDGEPWYEQVAYGYCHHRGFFWGDPVYPGYCGTTLRAYSGYVLDPRLLPATVAGPEAAGALPEYLGHGFPATVRLLRDAGDPPAS
ncbi:MAG: Tad protein [Actinomycetota bacterium]|nr:Tad protein [Actinomycetota bacterium]